MGALKLVAVLAEVGLIETFYKTRLSTTAGVNTIYNSGRTCILFLKLGNIVVYPWDKSEVVFRSIFIIFR